jgi:hypothetical protein
MLRKPTTASHHTEKKEEFKKEPVAYPYSDMLDPDTGKMPVSNPRVVGNLWSARPDNKPTISSQVSASSTDVAYPYSAMLDPDTGEMPVSQSANEVSMRKK